MGHKFVIWVIRIATLPIIAIINMSLQVVPTCRVHMSLNSTYSALFGVVGLDYMQAVLANFPEEKQMLPV